MEKAKIRELGRHDKKTSWNGLMSEEQNERNR